MTKNQYNTVKVVLNIADNCKTREDVISQLRKQRKISESKALQILEAAYELSFDVRKKIDALIGITNPFNQTVKQKITHAPVKQKSVDEVVREIKNLREFEENVNIFVKDHIAPRVEKIKLPTLTELNVNVIPASNRVCILVVTDTHIGSSCKSTENDRAIEWNSEIAIKSIHKVVDQLIEELDSDRRGYDEVIVAYGGDLFHTLTGTTQKGTKLERELSGPEQFEKTLEAMIHITLKIVKSGRKVRNYFVVGNHDGVTGWCLGQAAKMIFDTNSEYKDLVSWEISKTENIFFEASDNTLVCLHHGASATTDFKFGIGPSKVTEAKVQPLFSSYEKRVGKFYNSQIFIVGDKHHFSCHEYATFTMVQVGSIVKADHYAENMKLRARPQQGIITVNNKGLETIRPIYTD